MEIRLFKKAKEMISKKICLSKRSSYRITKRQCFDNEELKQIAKEYDDYGYMSKKIGKDLEKQFESDEYIIGIHRTGYTPMNSKIINQVFNEGLINNGHAMSGGVKQSVNIEDTVTLFSKFFVCYGQIKSTPDYKNSQGCFIIKIPKSYLGKKEGEIKPIYYLKQGYPMLLPEFIYGYVWVNEGGFVKSMVKNPNYSDYHIYNDEELLYDSSVNNMTNSKKIVN